MTDRRCGQWAVMAKVQRCERCKKRYRGSGDWNATVRGGKVVGVLCPDCQTPDENAEAVVNQATLVYGRNAEGQVIGRPKVEAVDTEALVLDLIRRTEEALQRLASLVVETGMPFALDDAVQMVEDGLPPGYPTPAVDGVEGRRAMIAKIARDSLSGELYEDG
jgi:hypothetical protein